MTAHTLARLILLRLTLPTVVFAADAALFMDSSPVLPPAPTFTGATGGAEVWAAAAMVDAENDDRDLIAVEAVLVGMVVE